MLINLIHGEPVRFGAEGERGVVIDDGVARIVDVAGGVENLHVHDEAARPVGRLRDQPFG